MLLRDFSAEPQVVAVAFLTSTGTWPRFSWHTNPNTFTGTSGRARGAPFCGRAPTVCVGRLRRDAFTCHGSPKHRREKNKKRRRIKKNTHTHTRNLDFVSGLPAARKFLSKGSKRAKPHNLGRNIWRPKKLNQIPMSNILHDQNPSDPLHVQGLVLGGRRTGGPVGWLQHHAARSIGFLEIERTCPGPG